MKRISKKRLLQLGFTNMYREKYVNGNIMIIIEEDGLNVLVNSQITFSEDYARPAVGCKNEKDLIELLRLING